MANNRPTFPSIYLNIIKCSNLIGQKDYRIFKIDNKGCLISLLFEIGNQSKILWKCAKGYYVDSEAYNDGRIFLARKDWTFPIPIAYGPGRLAEIGSMCERMNIFKPLIVTDSGSKNLGFNQTLKDHLKKCSLVSDVFFDISPILSVLPNSSQQ